MNKTLLYIFFIFLGVSLFMPSKSFANKNVIIEGRFNGANCMFLMKKCPINMSESHIASEPDFVLTLKNNTYYYVSNIDRAIKARYLHKNVRVTGVLKDAVSIFASKLELKRNGSYIVIWTWKKQLKERLLLDLERTKKLY